MPAPTRLFVLYSTLLVSLTSLADAPKEIRPTEILKNSVTRTGYVNARFAATEPDASDSTNSPYLTTLSSDGREELVPLKKTDAQVNVSGPLAHVTVRQTFENSGTKPIEAIYLFPASTRAAVHSMRMKIGTRTIEAQLQRRDVARQTYETARNKGQRASLLEQQRANVFTMNVANIMPNDRIEVELQYSELLIPHESVYEFVYPTVVGPRYAGGTSPQTDKWIANPYLTQGTANPVAFDFNAHFETGIPLKELSSPSHRLSVNYLNPHSADVRLEGNAQANKDVVLHYRLAGDQIESGVLLSTSEKENFFTLMLQPPKRVESAQITPREYIFVLDVSGSMHGFPLDTAKQLMRNLLGQLRPEDAFNVVLFSGASYVWAPSGSMQASQSTIARAIEVISQQTGGGGTELLAALKNAYAIPKKNSRMSRSVIVVTDGYVGVEAETFRFIRNHLDEANSFALGIGSSVNRGLIEGMGRAGLGESFVVLKPDMAQDAATKLMKMVRAPVLTNIQVKYRGIDAYEVSPWKIPDLLAERPLVIFGKFRGAPSGEIEVTGDSASGRFSQTVQIRASNENNEKTKALKWLWARSWVATLEDEHHLTPMKELEDAITDLGLSYSLLTPFTSFVAVDSQVVNRTGHSMTVEQPLPLPEGVSNLAAAPPTVALQGYGVGGGANEKVMSPRGKNINAKAAPEGVAMPMRYVAVPNKPIYSAPMTGAASQKRSEKEERQRDDKPKDEEKQPSCKISLLQRANLGPDWTQLRQDLDALISKLALEGTFTVLIEKSTTGIQIKTLHSTDASKDKLINDELKRMLEKRALAVGSYKIEINCGQ